ncbi:recombinase family protein [Nitrospirota bacterium]
MKIIGYLRVSTGGQDIKNQRLGILELANRNKWKVEFVEETASGTLSYRKRALGGIIDSLQEFDVLIVPELSRIGRSLLEILEILKTLKDRGVKVHTIKEGYEINGDAITSKVMTMVFGMLAELERDLISKRTKEALAVRRSQGVRLGRPPGPGKSKLDGKEEEIWSFYKKGVGVTSLARIFDCTPPTMGNFIQKKVLPTHSGSGETCA